MPYTEIYRQLSRLEQRVSNIVRVGRIAAVQDSPPRVKVEYDKDANGDPVTSAWLCYFEQRQGHVQTWNPPKVGEQCMIVSPSGDLRLGKVLLGLNTTDNPPISTDSNIHKIKFSDGSTFEYNRASSQWTISLGSGNATFNGTLFTFNADIVVNGDMLHDGNLERIGDMTQQGKFTHTGDVSVTGNITATEHIFGKVVSDATGSISSAQNAVKSMQNTILSIQSTIASMQVTYNGHKHGGDDDLIPDKQMQL